MDVARIVVPLDFGAQADRALPVACALADRLAARLTVLVVTSPRSDRAADEEEARWHARHAGCRLDDVLLRTDDDVVAGILAAAASPQAVLCLATSAPGPASDILLRSVGEQVLCRSPKPVVAVGPAVALDPPTTVEHVLGGVVDDARLTDRLVDVMVDWAGALAVDAHLVRVIPPGDEMAPDAVAAARRSLDVAVRRLRARGTPATSTLVTDTDPCEGILRSIGTRPGSLSVLASHGRSGLRRLTLGSVTLALVRRSPMPVLVVPSAPPGAPGAEGAAAEPHPVAGTPSPG